MSGYSNKSNESGEHVDQGTPNWLKFPFFGFILIGLVYSVFAHGFLGYNQEADLRASLGQAVVVGAEGFIVRSPEAIADGQKLAAVCGACHGLGLVGLSGSGPSLVDSEWAHGTNTETSLHELIVNGITASNSKSGVAMPARGTLGNDADVWRVVYYLSSINSSIKQDAGKK